MISWRERQQRKNGHGTNLDCLVKRTHIPTLHYGKRYGSRKEEALNHPTSPEKLLSETVHQIALSRTIAQVRTGHWLCASYLKRVRKNRDEDRPDKCWWYSKFSMSRTHIFFRCTHPKLEQARKDIWDRPDEEGIILKWPTSVGQLVGKAKREKRLADWIIATGVGLLGCTLRDFEAERVERY
jgi:hypothetical protein